MSERLRPRASVVIHAAKLFVVWLCVTAVWSAAAYAVLAFLTWRVDLGALWFVWRGIAVLLAVFTGVAMHAHAQTQTQEP